MKTQVFKLTEFDNLEFCTLKRIIHSMNYMDRNKIEIAFFDNLLNQNCQIFPYQRSVGLSVRDYKNNVVLYSSKPYLYENHIPKDAEIKKYILSDKGKGMYAAYKRCVQELNDVVLRTGLVYMLNNSKISETKGFELEEEK